MDLFAAEIGMDRAEVRRKNFIQPDQFPYENPSGLGTATGGAKIYIDSGNYEPAMDKALAHGRLRGPRGQEGRGQGPRQAPRPRPVSTYIEVCGVAPSKWIGAVGEGWGAAMWESSNIKVHLTGKVVVTMGTQPQGQGHETTYAQVVADELGVPMEDIVIQHSDTQGTPFGYGSYGVADVSSVGMTAAIKAADKIKDKARRYAAHMLEASVDDIEIDGAEYRVKGSPDARRRSRRSPSRSTWRSMRPRAWSRTSTRRPTTTRRTARGRSGPTSRSSRSTRRPGVVDLVRYVAVDDVGNKINPMIVDGQLHGGIAQGVGQALWEGAVYSDEGQLLTGSMLDYALPKASRLPIVRARRDGDARRRSTRSGSRASARPARSPRPRPSPTPSSTRSAPLGIRHLDMPYTAAEGLAARSQSAKGGQA